jgi:hypothetical protein
MEGYSYVLIVPSSVFNDSYSLRDIPDLCHVNLMYLASSTFDQPKNWTNNISYRDVHDSIVYGFDLSWSGVCCDFVKESPCKLDEANISLYCGTLLSLSLSLSLTHTQRAYLNLNILEIYNILTTQFADKKRKIMRYRLS